MKICSTMLKPGKLPWLRQQCLLVLCGHQQNSGHADRLGRPLGNDLMQCRLLFILVPALFFASTAMGEIAHGQFSFGDERSCSASGKLSAELCANAAANARTEFEEKAPRFPTRDACERAFDRGGCSLGFSGTDGWAGKKSGIYFSPRQAGFRIWVSPKHDMIVVPYVTGKVVGFSARTIARRDTHIDLKTARQAREAWRFGAPSAIAPGQGAVGLDNPSPVGNHDPLPPPPPADPNFNCAAVLEAGSDATTGCYPAPPRQR